MITSACIFCSSEKDLNTQFTISVDEEKITVSICDEHAEKATVKTAKAAYVKAKAKLGDVEALAKKLGYSLTPTGKSGLVLAEGPPKPAMRAQVIERPQEAPVAAEGEFVDTAKILDFAERAKIDASQVNMPGIGGGMGKHDLSSVRRQLTESGVNMAQSKSRAEVVTGRCGQPVVIPSMTVDSLGTTTVRVVPAMTPHHFDRRFKDFAAATKNDLDHTHEYAHGYDHEAQDRPCPLCRGDTTVVNAGMRIMCPKCKGSGLL